MPIYDSRSRGCIAVLQLAFALAVLCVRVQSQAANPPKMIQIKLEQYGWQRLPPPVRHEAWPTEARLMSVDSKGRVLIGYPAREDTDLATRGNPRLSFRIIRFTPEGKLDLSVSLPTNNLPYNAVFLDAQDHILAVANEMLQILTGDDQTPTQQHIWKTLTECSWSSQQCVIEQSPTRRSLFVTKCLGSDANCEKRAFTLYDSSLSEPQVAKTCNRRGGRTTDKFGYLSGWDGGYFTRRYPLCDLERPEELPLDDPVCAVLNDDLFVTAGMKKKRWEVGVVTAHGDVKFRLQLPKHDSPPLSIIYAKGDASGDRFAFVIDTLRGGSAALDIGGHLVARRVVVYSSDSGAPLTSLNIYPPVPHYGVVLGIVPGFTFDLSPNGHVLAVLSEGILTIAKIEFP
jgi:hypothetical protein